MFVSAVHFLHILHHAITQFLNGQEMLQNCHVEPMINNAVNIVVQAVSNGLSYKHSTTTDSFILIHVQNSVQNYCSSQCGL